MANSAVIAAAFLIPLQMMLITCEAAQGASSALPNPVVEPLNTNLPLSLTIAQTDLEAANPSKPKRTRKLAPLVP